MNYYLIAAILGVITVTVVGLGYSLRWPAGEPTIPLEPTKETATHEASLRQITFTTYTDEKLGISVSIPSNWIVRDDSAKFLSYVVGIYSPDYEIRTFEEEHPGQTPREGDDAYTIIRGARFQISQKLIDEESWQPHMDGQFTLVRLYRRDGQETGVVLTTVHKGTAGVFSYRIFFYYDELPADYSYALAKFISGFRFIR